MTRLFATNRQLRAQVRELRMLLRGEKLCTADLQRDLDAERCHGMDLNEQILVLHRQLKAIASERDKAWREITDLEIERDAAEMRADAYENGAA